MPDQYLFFHRQFECFRSLRKTAGVGKMVPFYGTVYKSILYDLIIPFPACEAGAEREKKRAVVFASGKTGKSE